MRKWHWALAVMLLWLGVQAAAEEEHEHKVRLTESIVDGVYEMLDENQHLFGGEVHKIVYCMECGHVYRTEPLGRTEERTEEHAFQNGRCGCGYVNPCGHPNGEVTQQKKSILGYEAVDGESHVCLYLISGERFCPECGEVFEIWIEEEGASGESEPHRFGEGTCGQCGYVNDCPHEETFSVDWLENTAYEPIGSKRHQVTADLVEHIFCKRCLEEQGYTFVETVSSEEEHVYAEGKCVWCGDENSCDHPEVRTEYHIFEPAYEAVDEKKHIVRGEQTEVIACRKCGEAVSSAVYDGDAAVEEAHEFDEGVCVCGYVNACTHGQTESRRYIDSTAFSGMEDGNDREVDRSDRCEPLNERLHVFRGDLREETVCLSCGGTVSDVLIETEAEQTEGHLMIDGICAVCGYESMCMHEEVRDYFYIEGARYEAQEDGTHLVQGDRWRMQFCQDCGEELERELVEEDVTDSERHSYADGACVFCGAANECIHERKTLDFYLNDAQYEAEDEWTHNARGTLFGLMTCSACLEGIPLDLEAMEVERAENHTFVDGVCISCGAENECVHELVAEVFYSREAVCTPQDEHVHRMDGTIYSWRSCRECFVLIDDAPAENQEMNTQAHTFRAGICTGCGYENPCAHERTETTTGIRYGHYARTDGERHRVSGAKFETTVCTSCGEELGETLLEYYVSEEEAHDFTEGVCERCGQRREDE